MTKTIKNRKTRSIYRKTNKDYKIFLIRREENLLLKYSDKKGIYISISEIGDIPGVIVDIFDLHTYTDLTFLIDYCVLECIWDMDEALSKFKSLGNRSKVARRWLRRNIINLEFGKDYTGKYVRDYILPNGEIDVEKALIDWEEDNRKSHEK